MSISTQGRLIAPTLDNVFFYCGLVVDDNTSISLQLVENALRHYLHFTRTVDGTLTDVSAPGGVRVHLHYDDPLGRLTDVKRIVGNEDIETLVQYRYTDDGKLSEAINRNGDTMRRFSYAEA